MAEILVIDDDPQFRRILKNILLKLGHAVHEAPDGNVGIRLFQQVQPTLVICDIVMPDTEGIQTIRAIRQQVPSVPILAISGAAGRSLYLQAASTFGASAALEKPFTTEQLTAKVAELLRCGHHISNN